MFREGGNWITARYGKFGAFALHTSELFSKDRKGLHHRSFPLMFARAKTPTGQQYLEEIYFLGIFYF